MNTQTSVRSLRKPALHTAGWLLLAITIWLFSSMASAQAQTRAPAGWSVLGVTNTTGILSESGITLHPVQVFDACSGRYSADLLSEDEARLVSSMTPFQP